MPELYLRGEDGYPTEEALEALPLYRGTARQLVNALEDGIKAYGGFTVRHTKDDYGHPVVDVSMATGGWSGN